MKKRKTSSNLLWLFGMLCLLFTLLAAGCKQPEPERKPAPQAYAYSVKDSQGYEINFMQKPQRIISLSISTDEILIDLVDVKRIVALTYLSDDAGISNITAKAKKVKGRVQQANAEALLAMQPDLLLIPDFVSKEEIDLLRRMQLNVYVYKTPATLEEIKQSIRNIGAAVGEPERAQDMLAQMERHLAAVTAKLGEIQPDKRKTVVFMRSNGAYYRRDMTFNDICRQAQVKNALDELDYDKPFIASQEEIVRLNPDVFILAGWNYDGQHDQKQMEESLLTDPTYSGVKAIKNKAVYTLPAVHLLSTSQYIVDAIADMAHAVYGAEV